MKTKTDCFCGHDMVAHISPVPCPGVEYHACLWEGCKCTKYDPCTRVETLSASNTPEEVPELQTPCQDTDQGEIGPPEAAQEPLHGPDDHVWEVDTVCHNNEVKMSCVCGAFMLHQDARGLRKQDTPPNTLTLNRETTSVLVENDTITITVRPLL